MNKNIKLVLYGMLTVIGLCVSLYAAGVSFGFGGGRHHHWGYNDWGPRWGIDWIVDQPRQTEFGVLDSNSRIATLEAEKVSLLRENDLLSQTIKTLKNDNRELEKKNKKLKDEMSKLEKKLDRLEQKLEKRKTAFLELMGTKGGIESGLDL